MLKLAVLAAATAALGLACHSDDFQGLYAPFNLNPFSNGFTDLIKLFNAKGVALENYCANNNSAFLGQAFMTTDKDKWLVLIKDMSGKVAGMQSYVPTNHRGKSGKLWAPDPSGIMSQYFIKHQAKDNGQMYWVQTVYFQDPSTICSPNGRKSNTVSGDGLWLQNGPNPLTNFFHAPRHESDIQSTTWANTGKCFWTMGQHYWGNVHKNLACKDMIPYCLLYNGGCLDAFCFAINMEFDDQRFDSPHPTSKVLKQFMSDPAMCMQSGDPDWSTFSTQHVYLSNSPRSSFC